ncbi:MAG: DUF434 domain-containing protein [Opitutaceae bacterium]|nr:DUF434 domain-containing protein [Opitutaceae bacterium]
MPDSRIHRGPHPEDARLFAPPAWPTLQQATADLCWLLSRNYAAKSALKLVGDRHQLTARQREAVERCACPDALRADRQTRRVATDALAGRTLWLDGYNVLTTVEVALGGGVILAAGDGTYRDIASMHGTYRKVAETLPALELLGGMTAACGSTSWHWLLDRPVSNSGRLKTIMADLAARRGWPWQIELVPDPDAVLADSDEIVATADSLILDRCRHWYNLAREAIDRQVPQAHVVPLGGDGV